MYVVSTPKKYTPKEMLTCTYGATFSSIIGGLFQEALRQINFSIFVSNGVPARALYASRRSRPHHGMRQRSACRACTAIGPCFPGVSAIDPSIPWLSLYGLKEWGAAERHGVEDTKLGCVGLRINHFNPLYFGSACHFIPLYVGSACHFTPLYLRGPCHMNPLSFGVTKRRHFRATK